MRLLIVTQKVNIDDPILGFFHRWIIEFAKHFESITVICLEMGKYELPKNVKVLSLGKEERQSRLQYLIHFYWYIQHEKKNYDAVFVHMNQEYLILAGWLWRLWGKRVTMWRNHFEGSFLTDIASIFCHKVFCTSKYSFTAKYKKTVLMPVGIDTEIFKPVQAVDRMKDSILFLGRIAPSKRPDILIDSLILLDKKGIDFFASIYGDPSNDGREYYQSLLDKVRNSNLIPKIKFYSYIPNHETPIVYSRHQIFVNLSPSGMYDKTIFEAMACGCLSISSNKNLEGMIDNLLLFEECDIDSLSNRLQTLLTISKQEKDKLCRDSIELVNSKHSLSKLALSLYGAIESIA